MAIYDKAKSFDILVFDIEKKTISSSALYCKLTLSASALED